MLVRRYSRQRKAALPKGIAELISWRRADAGITLATGVSAWQPQAGSVTAPLVQAVDTAQPAWNADGWAAGKPAVLTDGVRTYLWNADDAIAAALGDQNYVVALAIAPQEFASGDYSWAFGTSTSSTFDGARNLSSFPRYFRSGGFELQLPVATAGARQLQVFEMASTAMRLTVKTSASTTSVSGERQILTTLDRFCIGGILRTAFGFAGKAAFAEIIIAQSVIDMNTLLNDMESRWPLS